MGINRSGYYKWKSRQGKLNRYEQDRILLTQLLHEEHELHPSLGYHRLARNIFHNTGWVFSDNLAHKCCKAAGIRSKARKCRYRPKGEESIKYENLVKGHWNAKAPLPGQAEYPGRQKRGAETPGSLPYRPGSRLLLQGILPRP